MSCGRPTEEDDAEGGTMPVRQPLPASAKCTRCKEKEAEIVRVGGALCADCFSSSLGKRFREVMQLAQNHCRADRHSTVKRNGTLLLAHSGSLSSRLLLDLVVKYCFKPDVLKNSAWPPYSGMEILRIQSDNQEADEEDASLRSVADANGFTLTVTPVEQIYTDADTLVDASAPELPLLDPASVPPHDTTSLPQHPLFSITSKATLSTTILNTYIAHYAAEKGHKAVLFCDTSTKLAAKTLAAMAKGQGWSLSEQVTGADVPVPSTDVRIYRPLSQVSSEEVRFYASSVKGWPVRALDQPRSTSRAADIDGLLDAFIGNLEAGFPATVSVISRTAAKMAMRSQEAASSQRLCPLCGNPADHNAQAWREAASLTSLDESNSTSDYAGRSADASLAAKLCYGCSVPFWELHGKSHKPLAKPGLAEASPLLALPKYSESLLGRDDHNTSLREEIADYLL